MKQLSSKQKLSVILGILFTVFVIFIYEGVFAQLGILQNIKKEYKELGEERGRLEYQKEQVKLLEQKVSLVKTQEAKLKKVFLPEEDLVKFVGEVERSARNAGISLVIGARANTRIGEKGFAFFILSEGQFSSSIQFIDQMQNLENVVLLENVSMRAIQSPGGDEGGGVGEKVSTTSEIFVPFQ